MTKSLRMLLAACCLSTLVACGGGGGAPTPNQASVTITAQPANQTVLDGQPASFSVAATGVAPLSYQWKQGATVLAGKTMATLAIAKTIYAHDNGRQYSVDVTDGSGATVSSQAATLTITPIAPTVTAPLSQTVVEGSTASFSVVATGTLVLSYQWSRNGVALTGATAQDYTTGPLTYAVDNGARYRVVVTNGAGQTVSSAEAVVSVSQVQVSTRIDVDCSTADANVGHQVNYRRGLVQGFDLGGESPQAIVADVTGAIHTAGTNLLTATLNLNDPANANLFTYSAGSPPELSPNMAGSATLLGSMGLLRAAVSASELPALVQLSGTPAAFADYLDGNYKALCSGNGNFYPLPEPGTPTLVAQVALAAWAKAVDTAFPGAIWIGTQEPTHTLGFHDVSSDTCSSPTPQQRADGETNNVQRYITYWSPIAQALHQAGMKVGGVQMNAKNTGDYGYAADQIITGRVPLDYFTIQDYSPSPALNKLLYAAYLKLIQVPEYQNVKVVFDRYGSAKISGGYANAQGVIGFLQAESALMPYADMVYGYSVEATGVVGNTTILPPVLRWLQQAPAPLRPLTSTTSDLQAFALVRAGAPSKAYVAIWNVSPTNSPYTTSVLLNGFSGQFKGRVPTVLKASGSSISVVNDPNISLSGNTLSGLSVNAGEALLISIE
jgi:hypothetical protein